MNTQDIIKAGFKNCPVCNKPPLLIFDNGGNMGIGCCSTGIISNTQEDVLRVWNNYVDGKYKEDFHGGLGLVYNSDIFYALGFDNIKPYPNFDIKKVCKHNKRTCNTDSDECWCNPIIEEYPNGYKLIIHNEDD